MALRLGMIKLKQELKMENKKIDAVDTNGFGQMKHIHCHNCGDIKKSNLYTMTRNFKKTIEILESPFAEYSNLEFTILERKTRCGKDGNAYMELPTGDAIKMIEPNVYLLDVVNDEDDEFYHYAYDENGEKIKYTLKQISEISCYTEWDNVKIFPCTKR